MKYLWISLNKESNVSDEVDIITKVLYSMSAFFGAWWLYDRKRMGDSHKEHDTRIRDLERSTVDEKRVRGMIEDIVNPIKESQTEIKADLKTLIRLHLEVKK